MALSSRRNRAVGVYEIEAALLARVQQAGEEYWATLPQWRAKGQTIDDVAPMSFDVRKAN